MSIKLPLRMGSVLVVLVFLAAALTVFATSTYAHSGRTDASGGHNCYVGACAGTYHYHHGGGGSAAPHQPNYVEEGTTNGKAHAQREAENIRTKTTNIGYQTGYSEGSSGVIQNYLATPPTTICDITFTFDTGTNETYKAWYKSGWLSECNTIARTVYQTGYDQGFVAGVKAIPANTTAETVSSTNDSSDGGASWVVWLIIGVFVGVPVLAGLSSGKK